MAIRIEEFVPSPVPSDLSQFDPRDAGASDYSMVLAAIGRHATLETEQPRVVMQACCSITCPFTFLGCKVGGTTV